MYTIFPPLGRPLGGGWAKINEVSDHAPPPFRDIPALSGAIRVSARRGSSPPPQRAPNPDGDPHRGRVYHISGGTLGH